MTFQVADDALEVGLVEDGFFLGGAEKERGATEIVDLAGDALGVIVDGGEESIREDSILTTGDAEVVFDVGSSLLEVEGFEVEADGDALIESLEGGEAQLVGQVGLAE